MIRNPYKEMSTEKLETSHEFLHKSILEYSNRNIIVEAELNELLNIARELVLREEQP